MRIAVLLLLAGCSGPEAPTHQRATSWNLSIPDGRTASLDIRFSGDAPTQIVTGSMTLAGATMPVGGYADADFGRLIATIDALHWIGLDFDFAGQGMSGELCDHRRTPQEPQVNTAQCAPFSGLPK